MKRLSGASGQAGAGLLIVLGLGLLSATFYRWLGGVSPSTARGLTELWLAAGLLAGLAFSGGGFRLLTTHLRRQARLRESQARIRQRMYERLGLVPVHGDGEGASEDPAVTPARDNGTGEPLEPASTDRDDTRAGQALELIPPATPWAEEQIT